MSYHQFSDTFCQLTKDAFHSSKIFLLRRVNQYFRITELEKLFWLDLVQLIRTLEGCSEMVINSRENTKCV